MKNCISPSVHANCSALETDDGYITIRRKSKSSDVSDSSDDTSVVIEDYIVAISHSKFVANCLYYICGFIIRSLSNTVSCEDCKLALHETLLDSPDPDISTLVHRKDRGGLQYSSGSVYKIVSTTESVISREIICCQKLPNISQFLWLSGSRFGSGSLKSEIRILRIGGGLCSLSASCCVSDYVTTLYVMDYVSLNERNHYSVVTCLFHDPLWFLGQRIQKKRFGAQEPFS